MAVLVDYCTPRLIALLLSTMLLSRGAADCPTPPQKEHIVLTEESLLKNSFPKDTEVTFDCTNGFEKHNGSYSITCTGTQWTEPDLMCKKKDCGHPEVLPNMIFALNEGTLFGASVQVTCEEGYIVIGSSYKRCYAKGWIGKAKCEPVFCKRPSEVNDGQHSWLSAERPSYGEVIQYFCNPGFTLNGTSHVICHGRGVYNSTPPTCEAIHCDLPSEVNDGQHSWLSAERPSYGKLIQYFCNPGFTLNGTSHVICHGRGVYNSTPPTCEAIHCDLPSEVNDGQHSWLSAERPSYGEVIQYFCNPGFTLNGTSHVICHGRGVYNSTPPTCEGDRFATTEDNVVNTEASSISSPSLVAVTVPATPATHGNLKEVNTRKDTDRDTKDAASSGRNAVVASVISTVSLVLIVLLIVYMCRFSWRRGSYDTQEDLKPGLLRFQSL
ncbi:unnamed protein product [Lota lota]